MKYTNNELINVTKQHSSYFTTTRKWDLYAKENSLPQSSVFKNYFDSWNNAKRICGIDIINTEDKRAIQKEKILSVTKLYKNEITTVKSWDEFAKKENLPLSHMIINYFSDWNSFRKELDIFIDKDEFIQLKRAEYIEIAKQHITQFSSTAEKWKEYAKINGLPSTTTYVENFGSWANAQSLAGVKPTLIKSYIYKFEKDYLIQIAKKNLSHFKHTGEWDRYAKEHNLPDQYAYIRLFGSMVNAKKAMGIIDIPTRKNYTREELIQLAIENILNFTTQEVWDSYARDNNLPKHRAFDKAFGSWKENKIYIHSLFKN